MADLDRGIAHPFGQPTGYVLLHEGQQYPPKAAVGLAARRVLGRVLEPHEFSSGVAPGQAVCVLRELKFDVEPLDTEPADPVEYERQRRLDMYGSLLDAGGPRGVEPRLVNSFGIFYGGRGIWRNKEVTGHLTPSGGGVAVGLLHTGSSYPDDVDDDCVIYHYPTTEVPGTDAADVEATKAAHQLKLPLFVVTYPSSSSSKRDVHLAWVETWDDDARQFLVIFGTESPPEQPAAAPDEPFVLLKKQPKMKAETTIRPGQARFRFEVLRRYGPACAVCDVSHPPLLDAAHICPWDKGGSDDPRNGLVLCALHHRAFDGALFAIEPETLKVVTAPSAAQAGALLMSRATIEHLPARPADAALTWRWERFTD